MSTYSSDENLHMFGGPYQIDVAADCFGRDVRVLLDGRSAYLEPEEARALAESLLRNAIQCEENAQEWAEEVQP